jgi:GTP cyclohydrolase I
MPNKEKIDALEKVFDEFIRIIDPTGPRSGTAETPRRIAKAWSEWTAGYMIDPASLMKTFEDGAEHYDQFVIVHNIPILSHCEHHGAAIAGHAHIGYLPNRRIVGLSKLARVADAYARRLQVQERLTSQIAHTVHDTLEARATGVIIRASHGCMSTRGVRIHGSTTTTSCMLGILQDDQAARAEFMSLCRMAEKDNE